METDFKTKFVFVVLSMVMSGACLYGMLAPLNQKAKSTMKEHLNSNRPGPFDEAMEHALDNLNLQFEPSWNGYHDQSPASSWTAD